LDLDTPPAHSTSSPEQALRPGHLTSATFSILVRGISYVQLRTNASWVCQGLCPPAPHTALSIQVLDISGTMESDVSAAKESDLHKMRLDASGGFEGEKPPQMVRLHASGGLERAPCPVTACIASCFSLHCLYSLLLLPAQPRTLVPREYSKVLTPPGLLSRAQTRLIIWAALH